MIIVERRNIYEVRYENYNRGFKFVVLYASKRTLTIMYLSEFKDPFTGTNALLNRIETRNWNWFERNKATYIGQMSKSEYQKVLHLMLDLFSGVLFYSNSNMQYYYDDNDIVKQPELQDDSDEINEENPVPEINTDGDSKQDDAKEPEVVEPTGGKDDSKNETRSICITKPSESELITEVHADGTVLYDIMSVDYTKKSTNSSSSSQTQHKHTRTKNKNKHFRLFTIDEIESIALLEVNIVTQIYSVSKSVAYTMIRNSKAITGLENSTKQSMSTTRWADYFSNGYTNEQISAFTGMPTGKIASLRNTWEVNQNGDPDNVYACKEALSNMSNYDLACELKLGQTKLARKYGVSASNMNAIMQDMYKNVLAANLFYLAFGPIAYDEDAFNEKIEHARKCSKRKNSAQSDVILYVYDSLKTIESIYAKSLNDHAAILVGDANIPDEIADEKQRRIYYSTIKKRFAGLRNDHMYELDSVQKAIREKDIYDLAVYMLETKMTNLQYAIRKFNS